MCLPACPTYQVTGAEPESPRGRLYLMHQVQTGDIQDVQRIRPHLDACLGCQACETVCPSGVQYGRLLFATRARMNHPPGPASWPKRWALAWLLPNGKLLRFLGSLARFYQRSPLRGFVRKSRLLRLCPPLARAERFLPEVPPHRLLRTGVSFGNPDDPRVVLMLGCVMDVFYNPVHWDTVRTLTANRYFVTIPEQTCCGALAHHDGDAQLAKRLAWQSIQCLGKCNPDWVVLNSAGCGAAMKHYPDLFIDEDPKTRAEVAAFSAKVVDLLELLDRRPLRGLSRSGEPPSRTFTYHPACHLHHAQGVREAPMRVLSQVPGVTWVPLPDAEQCCGSAGTYNLEQPELSDEILARKLAALRQTGAAAVVTANPGCMLHLCAGLTQMGTPMEVLHPATVLAQAYEGVLSSHARQQEGAYP